jgi:hypothetical protein
MTNGVDAFLLLILMSDAMENWDVAIADVAGAYLHAKMDDFMVMRIVGREAKLMCSLNPEWKQYMILDKWGRTMLYMHLKKALYGCMKSALLWYELYLLLSRTWVFTSTHMTNVWQPRSLMVIPVP